MTGAGLSTTDPRIDGLHEKVALTYDNTATTDGIGAQLQRVYGIYAVARLLGASYLHTPVLRVDYQGLSAKEAGVIDPTFPHAFNELCHIDSDVSPATELLDVRRHDISMEVVEELAATFDRGETGGRPSLLHVVTPYGISEHFSDCYEVCKAISPFEAPGRDGRPLRVAVHVRRGELYAIESSRMLPNSYYVMVARAVAEVLESLDLEYRIELWTEVPDREFAIQPDDGIFRDITSPVVVNAEMVGLDDFDELPNLVPCINGKTIDCLRALATADVLVMSRSSFSFISGVLNRSSVVLYHPFWHRAPSSWIPVDRDGGFDRSAVEAALDAR